MLSPDKLTGLVKELSCIEALLSVQHVEAEVVVPQSASHPYTPLLSPKRVWVCQFTGCFLLPTEIANYVFSSFFRKPLFF